MMVGKMIMEEIVKRRNEALEITEQQYTIEINNGVELVVAAQNYYRRVSHINARFQNECEIFNITEVFKNI
jgi:hypothetical protein